jgi:hypothetical protein
MYYVDDRTYVHADCSRVIGFNPFDRIKMDIGQPVVYNLILLFEELIALHQLKSTQEISIPR